MPSPEINRCDSCVHECDEAYKNAANSGVRRIAAVTGAVSEMQERRSRGEIILRFKGIIGCELDYAEVIENIEALRSGRATLNG